MSHTGQTEGELSIGRDHVSQDEEQKFTWGVQGRLVRPGRLLVKAGREEAAQRLAVTWV